MLLWRQEWWGNTDHKKCWQTVVSQKYDLCLNQQQNLYLTFKSWCLIVLWFLWASKQKHDVLLHHPSSSLGTRDSRHGSCTGKLIDVQTQPLCERVFQGQLFVGVPCKEAGAVHREGAQSPGSVGPCLQHCAENWGHPAIHPYVCTTWIQTWVEEKL